MRNVEFPEVFRITADDDNVTNYPNLLGTVNISRTLVKIISVKMLIEFLYDNISGGSQILTRRKRSVEWLRPGDDGISCPEKNSIFRSKMCILVIFTVFFF